RLHRARHSLRELHPSADDSLGPAVGGVRRARHADRLPHGPEHLRLRRHDHADRHRPEERDHADRLRARSRALGEDAGSGDLRRLPDPLPPDHDDDDGGVAGRGADRGGLLVTLYLTPVVYTYMAQLQTWMKSRQTARTLTPATAPRT